MNEFIDNLMKRRSIRRYRQEPVARVVIDQLLTAASWAPSAHNRQPWRFATLTSDRLKQELARSMGQKLRADLQTDNVSPELIEKDVGRSYQRITEAPLLILLCLTMADMDNYPDERRQRLEWLMAVQSTAMAGQNLLLAAHSLGLGACWLCAPLFCPAIVRNTLQLPDDWQPQALITVGYPAETRLKARRDLGSLVQYLD